ncbi:MAG: hypothetical protein KME64_35205 [Scytonematopsis contorta HA4267-MV1]|jgi:hypothetical protein|nr:hypothetical protein [Scytonematopsis contorta HA4267-MV1]
MEEQANNIALKVMQSIAGFGDKAGRFIYMDVWRNELIDNAAQKLDIEVTPELRLFIETKLKEAWQRILVLRM